jgi:hypothetical protein
MFDTDFRRAVLLLSDAANKAGSKTAKKGWKGGWDLREDWECKKYIYDGAPLPALAIDQSFVTSLQ